MKSILKDKSRRTVIVAAAAAVCMVLAGATVYAMNAPAEPQTPLIAQTEAAQKATAQTEDIQTAATQAETQATQQVQETQTADVNGYGNDNARHYNVEHQMQAQAGYGSGANYNGNSSGIGVEKAKEIALGQVSGASASNITKAHCDYDDGMLQYDVEIVYNGYEYDFEINGTNGAIMEKDVDHYEYWD